MPKFFWKKEIKVTLLNAILFLLLTLILSGFVGGLFINYIFPQLSKIPMFSALNPRFPVIVNKTEEIYIDDGVNLNQMYENLRTLTVTVISSGQPFNPSDKGFTAPQVGAGVIVTSDGLIFTTKKNIGSPQNLVKVILSDGREFDAKVSAFDSRSELAMIKITADNLPVAQFAGAAGVQVGDKLLTVGPSLASFHNSGAELDLLKNAANQNSYPNVAFSDIAADFLVYAPALSSDYFGGGIVNRDNRVVGLIIDGGALTGEFLQSSLNNYLTNKRFLRVKVGFRYTVINPPISKMLQLPKDNGIIIIGASGSPAIVPVSPAAAAGLQDRDMIFRINSTDLSADKTFESIINDAKPGDKMTLSFVRNGQERTAEITLGLLP